jgi:hypothetical protein
LGMCMRGWRFEGITLGGLFSEGYPYDTICSNELNRIVSHRR